MHLEGNTGTVKVRRYGQSCQNCTDAPMVDPSVDGENLTILMENLVPKIRIKCYHQKMDAAEYSPRKLEVKSSHDPDNCEGCREGICSRD